MNTLNYYNTNAESFANDTKKVDFSKMQNLFLSRLSCGASILDFGCGSGRDTKCFLEKGYQVTATDGSEELCRLASEYTGIQVRQMLFQELSEIDVYDGIWACSSILHLSYKELVEVMLRMANALKRNGIVYTSFKYGEFEGERNGRYFTDMTEEKFEKFLREIRVYYLENKCISSDVRPGRADEKWLNVILRKRQ